MILGPLAPWALAVAPPTPPLEPALSVIDTVNKTKNLRTVPVECHGDDNSLSSYYWYMLANLISITVL